MTSSGTATGTATAKPEPTVTMKQASLLSKDSGPEISDLAARYLAPTYSRPPFVLEEGDGSFVVDDAGRRWLDLTSGIGVNSLGHSSPTVIQTLVHAATRGLIHTSNLYNTRAPILLAEELCRTSFADRVFFCNSGTESVEAAIKFARIHGGESRRGIVYTEGSFHGRTMGALAATDRLDYKHPSGPMPAEFHRVPWEDSSALSAIDNTTAAVIVEPVQGEGGVRVASTEWLQAIRRRCDETGALLILDEVQCGLGRTGRLWAHEHSGTIPDLLASSKPLAAGLPLGAVLMTESVATSLYPGCHGTTFGGGPLATAVALSVVRQIKEPTFLREVERKGREFVRQLENARLPSVHTIRGRGLMIGLTTEENPADVVAAAYEEDLLILTAERETVRLLPPLTISDTEIKIAVERLSRVFHRLRQSN